MGWKQGDEPILSTARTSWVASRYCWRLEMRGSYTNCSFISEANRVRNQGKEKRRYNTPLFPLLKQSMPNRELLSLTCRLFTSVRVSIGERPLFSASASGTASSAAENARIAYCSIVGICQVSGNYGQGTTKKVRNPRTSSAALATAIEQLISAAPPP